jgi:hypothetical protein
MNANGRRHEMEGIVELRLYPPLNVDAGRTVANPLKPLYFMAFVSWRFYFFRPNLYNTFKISSIGVTIVNPGLIIATLFESFT